MKFVFLLVVAGCGTTIHASDYASDCDADTQCVAIAVGDICSCSCNLAAINDREFGKYVDDVQRIGGCRNACVSEDPDAAPFVCSAGAQCAAGHCVTVALPSDGGVDP